MFSSHNIFVFFGTLILSLFFEKIWIIYMQKRELGQFIREDGPEAHLKKAGIPTMGGIAFIFSAIIMSVFFVGFNIVLKYLYLSIILFALVGFYDDYKKLKKKQNEGLSAKGKFVLILFIAVVIYFVFLNGIYIYIPFTNFYFENPIIVATFIALLYAAVTNATNFTDGIDGLLATVTVPIAILFIAVAYWMGVEELALFNTLFLAGLLGYLYFNKYPAKVFMGDLGSLAIGAYVVSNSLFLHIYWLIPIFGIWYVIEVLSVIIQVLYFKKTGGKRFFKMAPYHHHLEHLGMSEVKIVLIAFAITSIASIVSYYAILYRILY